MMDENDPVAAPARARAQPPRATCPDARCLDASYLGQMFQAYRCHECGLSYSKARLKANTEDKHPTVLRMEVDLA